MYFDVWRASLIYLVTANRIVSTKKKIRICWVILKNLTTTQSCYIMPHHLGKRLCPVKNLPQRKSKIQFLELAPRRLILNGTFICLNYVWTYVKLNSAVHNYPTRISSNVHLLNPITRFAHKSIRHTGPDIWNNIPLYVRRYSTISTLLERTHGHT